MDQQEYIRTRNLLKEQIKKLHKRIDLLDASYCKSVEDTLNVRGIINGSRVRVYSQEYYFVKVKGFSGDSIMITLRGVKENGSPCHACRNTTIQGVDDVQLVTKCNQL